MIVVERGGGKRREVEEGGFNLGVTFSIYQVNAWGGDI